MASYATDFDENLCVRHHFFVEIQKIMVPRPISETCPAQSALPGRTLPPKTKKQYNRIKRKRATNRVAIGPFRTILCARKGVFYTFLSPPLRPSGGPQRGPKTTKNILYKNMFSMKNIIFMFSVPPWPRGATKKNKKKNIYIYIYIKKKKKKKRKYIYIYIYIYIMLKTYKNGPPSPCRGCPWLKNAFFEKIFK